MSRFHRQVVLVVLLASVVAYIGHWLLTMIKIDHCPEYWKFKEFSFSGHIAKKYMAKGPLIDIEYNSDKQYGIATNLKRYNQVHVGDSVRKEKGQLDIIVIRNDTSFVLFDVECRKECEERKIR